LLQIHPPRVSRLVELSYPTFDDPVCLNSRCFFLANTCMCDETCLRVRVLPVRILMKRAMSSLRPATHITHLPVAQSAPIEISMSHSGNVCISSPINPRYKWACVCAVYSSALSAVAKIFALFPSKNGAIVVNQCSYIYEYVHVRHSPEMRAKACAYGVGE
jgi:hypothetical protein